jgi:hypothetical protein
MLFTIDPISSPDDFPTILSQTMWELILSCLKGKGCCHVLNHFSMMYSVLYTIFKKGDPNYHNTISFASFWLFNVGVGF